MATETPVNGSSADNLSFAEKLQKKHAESHNPTVEEVPDEDDTPLVTQTSALETADAPLSEKAQGKQKATEPQEKPKTQTLDTKSEELFPALGSGPKPRAPGPVSPAWGSKKPGSAANGINGNGYASSGPTSRVSTPASGIASPLPGQPRVVMMPGREREIVTFAPSQLLSRDKLKKPIPDILRDINKRSKATVEMKHAKNGAIAFEGTGPTREIVQQALKELAKQIGTKVCL
jgi:hypothetical protein